MVRVAPVKLKSNHRVLWFDPMEVEVAKGDAVVVSTARGLELGHMADDVIEVEEERIEKLKTPLKPVERKATEEDLAFAEELEAKAAEALPIFKEMAAETSEDMHPVSVEFLLDGDHAVFYFEAEERIDFRELVRKLASKFHVRVDMRQIGVRDEARMVGGLGHCGQELCCKRLGGEFCPVSIRMAKEQDLSLNPQKISGVCGRLMCCLRYEFDAYKDFKSRAPKKNAAIQTPEGTAKVADLDVPREVVTLKTEDGQMVKVPLASFEPAEEGTRPNEVGQEAWDEAQAPQELGRASASTLASQSLSGKDKLADPGTVRRTGGKSAEAKSKAKDGGNAKQAETRKPRRRSKVVTGGEPAADAGSKQQGKRGASEQGKGQSSRRGRGRGQQGQGQTQQAQGQKPAQGKSRRQRKGPDAQPRALQQSAERKREGQKPAGQAAQKQAGSVRPGRKSSALRQQARASQASDSPAVSKRPHRSEGAPSSAEGAGRRSRRRSHKAHGGSEGSSSGAAE